MPSSLTRVLPLVLGSSPRLPVSVCGTGAANSPSSFSRQCEPPRFPTSLRSASRLMLPGGRTSLPPALDACARLSVSRARVVLLCHCFGSFSARCGTGISTRCPSPTTPVLGLGPDLPWADEPSPGNLRLSTDEFLTHLSFTHTGILSCASSSRPSGRPSASRASLPYQLLQLLTP